MRWTAVCRLQAVGGSGYKASPQQSETPCQAGKLLINILVATFQAWRDVREGTACLRFGVLTVCWERAWLKDKDSHERVKEICREAKDKSEVLWVPRMRSERAGLDWLSCVCVCVCTCWGICCTLGTGNCCTWAPFWEEPVAWTNTRCKVRDTHQYQN